LWRGGIEVNDFELRDEKRPNDPPVVRIKEADMRASIPGLLKGRLGGQLTLDTVQLYLVNEFTTPEEKEKKKEEKKEKMKELQAKVQPWLKALREAMPMELTHFEMKNSRIQFVDRSKPPKQGEIVLDRLHIVGTGLSNRPEGEEMPARLTLDGVLTGNGKVHSEVRADPLAKSPRFSAILEVKEVNLPDWNPFLEATADVDVSKGTFEFYTDVQAKDGGYDGYVKPFFRDLDFKTAADANKNVGQRIKEAAADVVSKVLENDQEKKVATKAPFSGTFAQNQVDVWTTVENLLRNAFVQALREGFERPLIPRD
jgi:hypothetical protein